MFVAVQKECSDAVDVRPRLVLAFMEDQALWMRQLFLIVARVVIRESRFTYL